MFWTTQSFVGYSRNQWNFVNLSEKLNQIFSPEFIPWIYKKSKMTTPVFSIFHFRCSLCYCFHVKANWDCRNGMSPIRTKWRKRLHANWSQQSSQGSRRCAHFWNGKTWKLSIRGKLVIFGDCGSVNTINANNFSFWLFKICEFILLLCNWARW